MEDFGYGTVLRLLRVDDPKDYFGFFLKSDGIWLYPPDHERHRYEYREHEYIYKNGELVASPSQPSPFENHDYSKPVLPFPCTQEQLRLFLKTSGLDSMLDPEHAVLIENFRTNEGAYQDTNVFDDEKLRQETDEDFCIRLKQEGLTDKEIALALKRKSPKIYPSRIGRLITAQAGTHVTTDAYRKRGKRLLEIK